MTLRSPSARRLLAFTLLVVVLATFAVNFWAASLFRRGYLRRTESAMLDQARLLSLMIQRPSIDDPMLQLQAELPRLDAMLDRRITLISADGAVVADSRHPASMLENHADRPEIRLAATAGHAAQIRKSNTLHQDMLYVALRLGSADQPLGYIRLAADLPSLNQNIRSAYVELALASGLTLAAAALLCWMFVRSAARSLHRIAEGARAVLRGRLDLRLDAERPDEFGDIAASINALARNLANSGKQCLAVEAEFRAVLDSIVEGFIRLDSGGVVRLVNDKAARFFGFERQSSLGRRLADLVEHEEVLTLVDEVIRTGKMARCQVGPTSTALDLEVIVCPATGSEASDGVFILAHDIAESQRYQALRSEFIANVSHELRTPLTFIRGFVETLRDGAVGDARKCDHFLERIERNVKQLSNLVNDLLALSELEERGEDEPPQEVDVSSLLRRLCDSFQSLAESKRQRLLFESGPGAILITGRPRDLERLFSNLMDNALKYTDDGGWITVGVARSGRGVVVSVEDTGIGIPSDDLPRIFERFYRVDRSRSREMGGTGLGLSIVKHIVQAHHGRIEVDSKPGQGSKFTIWFPSVASPPNDTL